MQLIVNGVGGDRELLGDEGLVRSLLDRFPDEISMTKIAPPQAVRYVGEKPEDWGVSGFVLIAESHIALHTFPERGLIWADVFSCKPFDADTVVWELGNAFQLKALFVDKLPRGLEYPQDIQEAALVARSQREELQGFQVLPAPWSQRGDRPANALAQ